MSEILVFGAGYIGSYLWPLLDAKRTDVRINTYKDVQAQIDFYKPKVIINCIGHYDGDLDGCEKDIDKTIFSFSTVPLLLVEAAIRNGLKLVHITSGCMFEYDHKEDSPITEDMRPTFFDILYSRAKIYAEASLDALSNACDILQLRIAKPIDWVPHPKNQLTKMIGYKSVVDIPHSFTYMPDFSLMVRHLLKEDATGIYNCVNYGSIRYRDILEEYRKYVHTHSYSIMEESELKLNRTHPILSSDKLEESGFQVRDIHDVIEPCVKQYVEELKKNKQILL